MSKTIVPMIHVPSVRATTEWYESIGFNVVATYGSEAGGEFSFAIVSYGKGQVMFNEGGETSTKRRREVDLYVYTDNVDELYERLKDRVEVVEEPHNTFYGMRELIIRDFNRFWITFGEESAFGTLMNGINEAKPELVQQAVDSGQLNVDTLNVALAAALSKENEEIVAILKRAGATPPPHVDLEILESYAGKYTGPEGLEAELTVSDGRLFVTPGGQETMSLWPLDQRTFKPIAFEGATLIFNVEDGKTLGLTFIQNDHRMELKRT